MKTNNALIVYKTSQFDKYFSRKNCPRSFITAHKKYHFPIYKEDHESHLKTLDHTVHLLKKYQIPFEILERETKISHPSKYSLIITVGGDGTFLKIANTVTDQLMLGINSSPKHSVGKLCLFNKSTVEDALKAYASKNYKVIAFDRLSLRTTCQKPPKPQLALNDLLICHQNPAAMSHYLIKVKSLEEEQRGSGIWISTPAGSTGAISSAGGKEIPINKHKFQFLCRELYPFKTRPYKLTSGILNKNDSLIITSLMDNGYIYIDGVHYNTPFPYGCQAYIELSSNPVRVLTI
jgi:NAD+ kinase